MMIVEFGQAVASKAMIPWETLIPMLIELILSCFVREGKTAEQFRSEALNPSIWQKMQLRHWARRVTAESGVPFAMRPLVVGRLVNAIESELKEMEGRSYAFDPFKKALEEVQISAPF